MASLLSEPWIEDHVVSALLYHKQRKPQDCASQLAQVIAIRRNTNVVVLSDGKFSVEAFYDELNGTLRSETLVCLKDWGIVASGNSNVSRNKDAICFHIPLLDVVGAQGMGLVGNPSPVNDSVEVKRVLDSWKFTSTEELLRHHKPPTGDVAKLLQSTSSHNRPIHQFLAESRQGEVPTFSHTADRALTDHNDRQHPESPLSRKRPLPEQNRTPEKENTRDPKPPSPSVEMASLQEDREFVKMYDSDDSVVNDDKKMSISNMLVMENDDIDEAMDTARSPEPIDRKDTPLPMDTEESNGYATNRFLQLWMKWTHQSVNIAMNHHKQSEGSPLKKWRALSK